MNSRSNGTFDIGRTHAMEAKFKPGELVRLKSGSPVMTVHHTDGEGEVVLNWFDGQTPKSHVVPEALLERVANDETHLPTSTSVRTKDTW
jgi:uncharacterized protein YodC (DUF2158 family)